MAANCTARKHNSDPKIMPDLTKKVEEEDFRFLK